MLTAADLREFLKSVPDDAVVAVNGEIVTSAILAKGTQAGSGHPRESAIPSSREGARECGDVPSSSRTVDG